MELNRPHIEVFSVLEDETRITGMTGTDFTVNIYDPSYSLLETYTINEIGSGFYNIEFTPDSTGVWIVDVSCNYFPAGKSTSIDCNVDRSNIEKSLGLMGKNYMVTGIAYNEDGNPTESTIIIYNDSGLTDELMRLKVYQTYDVNHNMILGRSIE